MCFTCVHICVPHVVSVLRGQKRTSDPLGRLRYHTDAENQTLRASTPAPSLQPSDLKRQSDNQRKGNDEPASLPVPAASPTFKARFSRVDTDKQVNTAFMGLAFRG